MTKKILYISGTRADYGLMKNTLFSIGNHKNLKLDIAVCGMHLMNEFGRTIDGIKKDGFNIWKIPVIYEKDDRQAMAEFTGKFIQLLSSAIKKIKPNIILLLGDRGEMLAGAIVGAYLGILTVHIHGGEITATVDEFARHAITKLSHIHLCATQKSKARIIKMGEESSRVYVVGAPGLDEIVNTELFSKKEVEKIYHLDLSKPVLLVVQHPVTSEVNKSSLQMKNIIEAIRKIGCQTIIIYPNADAGGRRMIKVIEEYQDYPFIQIYKSIPRKDYLSLMKYVSVLIGNSSSGIIEAPSFHLPVVNVGTRQKGRERACNVIDAGYNEMEIKKAILKAIYDKKFREDMKKCKNPYGDGHTSEKIVKILAIIKLDRKLLQKQITY